MDKINFDNDKQDVLQQCAALFAGKTDAPEWFKSFESWYDGNKEVHQSFEHKPATVLKNEQAFQREEEELDWIRSIWF